MKAGEGKRRAALYARYSTDKQSEMSVEDQFRVSERIALREGFEVVARFEDRAITGGTSARPGYQAMLEGARRRQFDAIVAEDLKACGASRRSSGVALRNCSTSTCASSLRPGSIRGNPTLKSSRAS